MLDESDPDVLDESDPDVLPSDGRAGLGQLPCPDAAAAVGRGRRGGGGGGIEPTASAAERVGRCPVPRPRSLPCLVPAVETEGDAVGALPPVVVSSPGTRDPPARRGVARPRERAADAGGVARAGR